MVAVMKWAVKCMESATDFLPLSFTAASGTDGDTASSTDIWRLTNHCLRLQSVSSCFLANPTEHCWHDAFFVFPDFYQTSPWGKRSLLKSEALNLNWVHLGGGVKRFSDAGVLHVNTSTIVIWKADSIKADLLHL